MIELKKIPSSEWESRMNKVLEVPYIKGKYNRTKRIQEKDSYVKSNLPELLSGGKAVLDIGPGPGEFLEVCKYYGNDGIGIDAKISGSEMGDDYMTLAKLMTERQGIDVRYVGFENVLNNGELPFIDSMFNVINSQGAIEQVFRDHMIGPPIREQKDCRKLMWDMSSELITKMTHMFIEFHRILSVDGVVLIYANGCSDVPKYTNMIEGIIASIDGFKIEVANSQGRLHKIRKVS